MRSDDRSRLTTKLIPADARAHNRSLVLHTIRRMPDVSRADVSRITGLSRITVSELVAGLSSDGLVIESGPREPAGRPGKPPTLLRLNPDAFAVIALDLSQPERFRGCVFTLDGPAIHEAEVAGAFRGEKAATAVINLIAQLVGSTHLPIRGIGIGSPGIVDDAGTIVEATNLGWHHLALAAMVERRFETPTIVENDANAAIAAELETDTPGDLFLVRIGAGIGGAASVNGDLVRGANNAAGELGHVALTTSGAGDTTVEEALQTLVREATARNRAADAVEDNAVDDTALAEILDLIGARIGESISPAVAMLDVPEVVIEGPPDLDLATISRAAEKAIAQQRRLVYGRPCRVRPGTHGDGVVIRGMADLVLARALSTV